MADLTNTRVFGTLEVTDAATLHSTVELGVSGSEVTHAVRADRALSFISDSNVTISDSGTSKDLTTDRSWTLGWSGQLPVGRGGTGLSSLATGRIPFGNGTNAFNSSDALTYNITTNRLNLNSDFILGRETAPFSNRILKFISTTSKEFIFFPQEDTFKFLANNNEVFRVETAPEFSIIIGNSKYINNNLFIGDVNYNDSMISIGFDNLGGETGIIDLSNDVPLLIFNYNSSNQKIYRLFGYSDNVGITCNIDITGLTMYGVNTDYPSGSLHVNNTLIIDGVFRNGLFEDSPPTTDDNFVSSFTGSSQFLSGFSGFGWRIDRNYSNIGKTSAEFDNLTIRGTMRIFEMLINQIRATNGSLFISSTGKIESASSISGLIGAINSIYLLSCCSGTEHGFAVGDVIRAQKYTTVYNYQINMEVTEQTSLSSFKAKLLENNSYISSLDSFTDMEFVRIGNTTNTARQGIIYLSSDDSNSPFINILDGVTSNVDWNTNDKVKVRLGNLTGISDSLFGSLNGYGLYTTNGYFKGSVSATSGNIGGWSLNNNSLSSGGIHLLSDSTAANNKIYIGTGTYNNVNTPVYIGGDGKFSLKTNFVWSGTTLSIVTTAFSLSTTGIVISSVTPSISIGTTTSFTNGDGIWFGREGAIYKFRVGLSGITGSRLSWDGSELAITTNNSKVFSASSSGTTMAGWSILTDSISSIHGTPNTPGQFRYYNGSNRHVYFGQKGLSFGTDFYFDLDNDECFVKGDISANSLMVNRSANIGAIMLGVGIVPLDDAILPEMTAVQNNFQKSEKYCGMFIDNKNYILTKVADQATALAYSQSDLRNEFFPNGNFARNERCVGWEPYQNYKFNPTPTILNTTSLNSSFENLTTNFVLPDTYNWAGNTVDKRHYQYNGLCFYEIDGVPTNWHFVNSAFIKLSSAIDSGEIFYTELAYRFIATTLYNNTDDVALSMYVDEYDANFNYINTVRIDHSIPYSTTFTTTYIDINQNMDSGTYYVKVRFHIKEITNTCILLNSISMFTINSSNSSNQYFARFGTKNIGLTIFHNNGKPAPYDNGCIRLNSPTIENIGSVVNISASSLLSIAGNTYFNGKVGIGNTIDTNNSLKLTGNSYFNGNIGIGYNNYLGTTALVRILKNSSTVPALYLDNGTSSYVSLHVNGTIRATGDIIANYSSDLRLKEDITKIENPIEKISKISGYRFKWNSKNSDFRVGRYQYGIIAQELQEILPDAVTRRDDGYLAVDYNGIIPLLIEAIKELKLEINNLKK